MNRIKRFCLAFLAVVLLAVSASAEVQVFTHIEANGTSFNPGDSFSVYVVPVNSESRYLNNLHVNLSVPENIVITDTILPSQPDQLAPFESKVFEYVVKNVAALNTSLPVTGDRGLPGGLWLVFCGAAAALFWWVWRRNGAVGSGGKRFISLFLVFCFCTQLIPGRVIAEGNTDNLLVGEQGKLTIQVDGRDMTLVATATATEGSDMADVDADKDGLSAMEETAYGSDDNNKDTDGDGLNDFQEVYMFLDPTNVDSDGNGIPDGSEDVDGDGLVNLDELSRGTNPVQRDTDGDGLDDGNEVGRGTDPLKADTDGDGMLDGFEIEHGFDPKVFNGSVDISNQYDEASSSVIAKVVVRGVTGAQAQSLSVSEIPSDDILLGDHVPGWIGNAYEINMDNSSGGLDATLTMTYDRSLVGPDFEPEICLFNEENQSLDPVPNQTDDQNGTVTAPLTHFSVYILRNRKNIVVKESVNTIPLSDFQNGVAVLLDCEPSPSQESNAIWQKLSTEFPKKIQGLLGDQKAVLYHEMDNSYQGLETITYQNLNDYLKYWVSNTAKKVFYLVSSNVKKQLTSEQAQQIANLANANGKVINFVLAVKEQNYSNDDVKGDIELASLTQGKCYLVTDADSFLSSLDEKARPSDLVDSNGDGLTDGETWDIVSGKVLSDLYGNVFFGYSYDDIQANDDFDDDNLKNGKEIQVKNNKVIVTSLPTKKDSDYDGRKDDHEKENERLKPYYMLEWEDSQLIKSLKVKLHMDYRWFTKPKTFNRDMAVSSSLLAALSYLDDVNILRETGKPRKTRQIVFDDYLGMRDMTTVKVSSRSVHNAAATFGHHEFTYAGRTHAVVIAGITGYYDSGLEWISNFTVGNPEENHLWIKDGWIDKENHLGFDIAATKLVYAFSEYLSGIWGELGQIDELDVWTMGHSRGGAVSNLFAAKIADGMLDDLLPSRCKCEVFAYDFATPRGTTKKNVKGGKYGGIFNIINQADAVPMLPLDSWGFHQYGDVYEFNLHDQEYQWMRNPELASLLKVNFKDVSEYYSLETAFGKMVNNTAHKFRYNDIRKLGIPYTEFAALNDKQVLLRAMNIYFPRLSKTREGLYSFREAYDATKGLTDKLKAEQRSYIEAFDFEQICAPHGFPIPEDRPKGADRYYRIIGDYKKIEVNPEFIMVKVGYAAGQVLGGNWDPLKNLAEHVIRLSEWNSALGFSMMIYGSGVLSGHVDAAYYLGSYICKKQ